MSSPLRSITDYVQHWADRTPDAVALSSGDVGIGYHELSVLIDDVAGRLEAAGVRSGDRVVLAGINTGGWVVAFLAALRRGAIIAPLNSRLGSNQLPALIDTMEPRIALVDDSQAHIFEEARIAQTGVYVHHLGDGDLDTAFTKLPAADTDRNSWSVDPQAPALLSFTSGTTSTPKAALISHASLVAAARCFEPYSDLGPHPITTVVTPLFHNTGYVDQLCQSLVFGGQVDLVPRFRSAAAVTAMTRRPPTFLATVPSILRMLMLAPEADEIFAHCRAAIVGGASMPHAWIREINRRWPSLQVLHGYGLTEFTSASHLLPSDEIVMQRDSVGKTVPGVECSIRDEDGCEVPSGVPGEVWLAGPMRMIGYWGQPDATRDALSGKWLRTGDVGIVNEHGYLRLQGRLNQVINRGGEKIHPALLEDLLGSYESIAEVVVVGLPDPVLGERVFAGVVCRDGTHFDDSDARRILDGHVPDYALPEEFIVVDAIPHSVTGKPDRHAITEILLERRAAVSSTGTAITRGERHGTENHR